MFVMFLKSAVKYCGAFPIFMAKKLDSCYMTHKDNCDDRIERQIKRT